VTFDDGSITGSFIKVYCKKRQRLAEVANAKFQLNEQKIRRQQNIMHFKRDAQIQNDPDKNSLDKSRDKMR
jgi:hypothetical protein